MTNEEFYNLVLLRSRRQGDQVLLEAAPSEFSMMLQSMEHSPFHPWFLERSSTGLVTVANEPTIAQPDDYLLLVENARVFLVDNEGKRTRLRRTYHENIETKYIGEDSDLPKYFDIFAGLFWFGPIPDAEYEVKCKYYAKTTAPPNDQVQATNAWILNALDFTVTSVAERLVRYYVKDSKRADDLRVDAGRLLSDLHKYNEARKHAEMDYEVDS